MAEEIANHRRRSVGEPPATGPRARAGGRRWASRLLFGVGGLCLLLWAAAWVESRITEAIEGRRLQAALEAGAATPAAEAPAAEAGETPPPPPPPEPGSLIGRIEAPHLEVSAIVLAGIDSGLLRRAAGHVPGTAVPGGGGNIAVAGHRDLHFAGLKDVAVGDEITFTTPAGVHRYRVTTTEVVEPRDTHVLHDRGREELTLITCYPFHYIGPAPQRFIVRADRVF